MEVDWPMNELPCGRCHPGVLIDLQAQKPSQRGWQVGAVLLASSHLRSTRSNRIDGREAAFELFLKQIKRRLLE